MMASDPAALAAGIRRLRPSRHDPHSFHEEKDQLARAVARLGATAAPCALCPSPRQRRLLALAGAALRRQREALRLAHRLLLSARGAPVPPRHPPVDPRQLTLPLPQEPVDGGVDARR